MPPFDFVIIYCWPGVWAVRGLIWATENGSLDRRFYDLSRSAILRPEPIGDSTSRTDRPSWSEHMHCRSKSLPSRSGSTILVLRLRILSIRLTDHWSLELIPEHDSKFVSQSNRRAWVDMDQIDMDLRWIDLLSWSLSMTPNFSVNRIVEHESAWIRSTWIYVGSSIYHHMCSLDDSHHMSSSISCFFFACLRKTLLHLLFWNVFPLFQLSSIVIFLSLYKFITIYLHKYISLCVFKYARVLVWAQSKLGASYFLVIGMEFGALDLAFQSVVYILAYALFIQINNLMI